MQEFKQRRAWIKGRRTKRKVARHARVRQQLLRYLLMVLMFGSTIIFFSETNWNISNLDSEITVSGNLFTPESKIKTIVSKYLLKPVVSINPKEIEQEVLKLETVKYAFVRRYVLPKPEIRISVKEEFPWASLVPYHGPVAKYVITESGRFVPLRKFPAYPKPGLVVFANPQIKITKQHVKQWGTWIGYIEKQTGEKVISVDLLNKFDTKITTDKTTIRLGIPDTTLTQRLGRLTSIWKIVGQYRDRLEYIDLALDNNIPLKLSKGKRVASKESNSKKESIDSL